MSKNPEDSVIGITENISYDRFASVIHCGDEEIKLTKIQGNLLGYFLEHRDEVISKQKLMEEVWGRIVTENSVDQVVSILRGHLETDPASPSIIRTHYGRGFSLVSQIISSPQDVEEPATQRQHGIGIRWVGLLVSIPAILLVVLVLKGERPEENRDEGLSKHLLVLPMTFGGEQIGAMEQQGVAALLRGAFDSLQSEGEMIFDETSQTTKQAIEKHWRLENDLVVMRTNVVKNGDIYQAAVELSRGLNTIETTTLTASNLNDLVSSQVMFISNYRHLDGEGVLSDALPQGPDQLYIEALAHRKNGNLDRAGTLLLRLLGLQPKHFRARLTLSEVFLAEKKYDESLAQLKTLKSTPAYTLLGSEIELNLAKIKAANGEFESLINDLRQYQGSHLEIGEVKKARIQIQIGMAFLALADNENALKSLLLAQSQVSERIHPSIHARTYYGQGKVRMTSAIDETTVVLFEKSLAFAESAGDLHQQTLALNDLSHIALSRYEWERAIRFKKRALHIMELDNDMEGVASGLGTLVAVLNLRGQFTQASEVNQRLGRIARDLQSDALMMHFLHYDAILAMNVFDWNHASAQMKKQHVMAEESKNYAMLLNNAFLALELILLKKDKDAFMPEWDKRAALIKQLGFERFQVYMDLYLARYFKLIDNDEEALRLLRAVSDQARSSSDFKILVDAQNQLVGILLKTDAAEALEALNALEQHNPHPNPYLELKARALHQLGRNMDALNLLNQAQTVYHESWTAENQALLEAIEQAISQ